MMDAKGQNPPRDSAPPHASEARQPVYVAALAISVLWAAAPFAFAIGYRGQVTPLHDDAFALPLLVLLAAGPAAGVWGAAYLVRQGQKLASQARRAEATAREALAEAAQWTGPGEVLNSLREEIARSATLAETASGSIAGLREALARESDRLNAATVSSARTASELAGMVESQNQSLAANIEILETRGARLAEHAARQTEALSEVAQAASTHLDRAEASLAEQAQRLKAAAEAAHRMLAEAGDRLRQELSGLQEIGLVSEVESATAALREQNETVHRTAQSLRVDTDLLGAAMDQHAARLTGLVEASRASADEAAAALQRSGEALVALLHEADQRFAHALETARAEHGRREAALNQVLGSISQSAATQREELQEHARAMLAALAETSEQARTAADRLAEEARGQLESSSALVETWGASAEQRVAAVAGAARAAVEEWTSAVAVLEERAERLPEAGRESLGKLQEAVARGANELLQVSRRTSEEARAVDEAFQERLRRHFASLSDALRLMGADAAMPPPPEDRAADAPKRERRRSAGPAAAAEHAPAPRIADRGPRASARAPETARSAAPPSPAEPAAAEIGDSGAGTEASGSAGPADGDGRVLQRDLKRLGVEPLRTLSEAALGDIVAAIAQNQRARARHLVARLVPGAVSRLSSSLKTNPALAARSAAYQASFEKEMAAADDPKRPGALADLLASEAGRLYLLLGAAGQARATNPPRGGAD
ncbi:MAG TPA: hypothetical protein VLI41_03405 [Phenylobacterium sp.]|uniref:hypothetical protein n=1 Tax=Phenylobacterium sp. TaxID=1871053 RepID=UPI002B799A26|nr:hypothetical protein [Phenylobacterium sp.]HSV02230.1 hypothetical protein [Phenylobacterium sp.]